MKNWMHYTGLLLFAALFVLPGCTKDQCQEEYTYYEQVPVYKSLNEIRTAITNEAARNLKNPGAIYFYNDLVLINERREGIHVIDNSDPSNPIPLSFINIPCNTNMSVRGNVLYADNCLDLLAIDITDPTSVEVLSRTENIFEELWFDEQQNKYLVYYDQEKRTIIRDCGAETSGGLRIFGQDDVLIDVAQLDESSGLGNGSTGVGGSMARFTIAKDHLYMVSEFDLKVFELSNPLQPSQTNTISLGWGIETIFPHGDQLYIGSNSGMFIFDNSSPSNPTMLSALAHATACDPVFVKDNFAYVTLRDGTFCEGFNNQLDLIDISDLRNPTLVKSFNMDNPHGLSIDGNNLFLCEGSYGLKVFDIEQPEKLNNNRLEWVKDLHAFDVIVLPGEGNTAMVIGEDGFYQYNFDNPNNLKLLSKIQVDRE